MNKGVFYKKSLKILQYSQENNCVGVSFLIKMQTFRSTTLLKEDSNADVFLTILRKFEEQLFWRTYLNGCFWKFSLLC